MPETRAVFFDRDGTLMEEVDYCRDPAHVRAFPGLAAELRKLKDQGWKIIIITNQSGIGRGYFTTEEYQAVQAELERQLGGIIDATYFCPDHPDLPSTRRKPAPGMVEEAARDWDIDLAASWFVGDKSVDVDCGKAAGCRTILVLTGYGQSQAEKIQPDHITPDALAAIELILSSESR